MTDQIFEQSAGLILDIRIWSGSKNLKAEDFQGIELPPEELVSLGSKRIHNKETFKPIQALRTKAVTYLESVAVSLYGGKIWVVPADRLDEVQSHLLSIADEFEYEKNQFLHNFHNQQQQWLAQNSRWVSILEPYLDTPEAVEKKFGFKYRTFKMIAAQDDVFAENLSDDVSSTLIREVSNLATEAYETLKDKDRATPKNLNRLDRLASKLQGLAFVNPGVSIIGQELTQILKAKDSSGAMAGDEVFRLSRLLVQLKNPQVLTEILDAARNGNSYQFVYEDAATALPAYTNSKHQPRLPDAWF